MARFSSPIHMSRRNADAGLNPDRRGLQLSRRGKWVMTAFLVPGIAALLAIPFLPASDLSSGLSVMNISFVAGLFAVLTAYPWALMHSAWTPALRPGTGGLSFGNGGAMAVVVGLVLTAVYLAAAVRFGLWISHSWAELAPAVLFLVAGVVHLILTLSRGRRGRKPPKPL
jgi:hypothetical protein